MSQKVAVYRKEHFNAAHRLNNPAWDQEKNAGVFGKCNLPNYHGHNYELIIRLTGTPDPATGFVIDLKVLGDIVKDKVVDKVDHKNLNLDVDFMQGKMASCEIFVTEIWNILAPAIAEASPNSKLHYIKLVETPKNFVEYYGE